MILRTVNAAATLAAALLFSACAFAQGAVQQNGVVTTTHAACWMANGILYDCGAAGGGGSPGGSAGQVQWNNGGAFAGFTVGGDAALNTGSGALTVTKTGGVAFGGLATASTTVTGDLTGTWPNLTVGKIGGQTVGVGGTVALGGGLTTTAPFNLTFTLSGNTNITLPTSGTLLTALPSVANNTVVGNISGISAAPVGLTQAQVTAILNPFTSSLKGVAPASGGGTANYLRADGTWAVPAGSGNGTVNSVTAGACNTTSLGTTGGAITTAGTIYGTEAVNAQTAISYALQNSDQCKLLDMAYTGGNAVLSLPTAGAGGLFLAGWSADVLNESLGNMTFGGAQTVNGQHNLALLPGQGGHLVSDGFAWRFIFGSPWYSDSGVNSIIAGQGVTSRGNLGAEVFSGIDLGGGSTRLGRSQIEDYVFASSVANANVARLTTDGSGVGTALTVAAVGTSSFATFKADCNIVDTTTGTIRTYSLAPSILSVGATVGTTAVTLNGGGVVAGPTVNTPAALQAAPTFTADATYGGLNISYQPPTANTDTYYGVCHIHYVTTRYN